MTDAPFEPSAPFEPTHKVKATDVPPTEPPAANPATGQPALVDLSGGVAAPLVLTKRKPSAPREPSKTMVPGSALIPDPAAYPKGRTKTRHYWCGLMPNAPVEGITIGGKTFSKVTERLDDDPRRTGEKRRTPIIGRIEEFDERTVKRLLDKLPRTIIRFTSEKGQIEEPGTGKNIGDVAKQPKRGHVITIPSEAEVKLKLANKRHVHLYEADERDQPAARYLFAQLCEDQDQPATGQYYPDSLEVTGLEWPDELEK